MSDSRFEVGQKVYYKYSDTEEGVMEIISITPRTVYDIEVKVDRPDHFDGETIPLEGHEITSLGGIHFVKEWL